MIKDRFEEKRKYPRVNKDAYIDYSFKTPKGQVNEGLRLSVNISAGGLMFVTSRCLKKGIKLKLNINIGSVSKPIKAFAKVAWVKRREDGEYAVGVVFYRISEAGRKKILLYSLF
ncbi:MAG: PilZ domain-containing protein [Candidatus Omnitrophica bacterium]|nr:PilZ domain-containing protein [Candidatus Omnitrophota bacterium]